METKEAWLWEPPPTKELERERDLKEDERLEMESVAMSGAERRDERE
jgi:hypothetical protein